MKNFVKILRMIVISFLIFFVSMFVIEFSRMRESQKTMIMLSRIAGNYALTASQDAGELTGNNRTSGMYARDEYGYYLEQLGKASEDAEALGDSTLNFAYLILKADYDRAVGSGSYYLDAELNYTPIAFNLPYISQSMLEECYDEAMIQMVRNYKCRGIPSLFVANDTTGQFRINSGDLSVVTVNDQSPAYDNGNNMVGFSLVALDGNLIRSIYGNENYYNDTFSAIFQNLDTDMYEELRLAYFNVGSGNTTYIPQYNITFSTPWYYVSSTPVLCFRDSPLLTLVGLGNAENRIQSTTNTGIYTSTRLSGYSSGDPYYEDAFINEGQLMFHLNNFVVTTDFQYTFLG